MSRDKPFDEVLRMAGHQAKLGAEAYQTWTCPHCGQKQGIMQPNAFYTHGKCEECGTIEDMMTNGCGFDLVITNGDNQPKEITVYDARDSVSKLSSKRPLN